MNFELSEDERMIQDAVRRFADETLIEGVLERDAAEEFPGGLVSAVAELGLMSMTLAEADGGTGLSATSALLAIEALARRDGSLAMVVAVHNGFGLPIAQACDGLIPEHLDGRAIIAAPIAEKGAGRTSLSAPYVQHATHVAIYDDGRAGLLVAADLDFEPWSGALGLRALGFADVDWSDAVAGRLTAEFAPKFQIGPALVAAVALGLGRGALEEATAYATERRQFKKPIADFQAIQWKLADMAMELDAARLMLLRAVDQSDSSMLHRALVFASERATSAAHEAIQILGGNGYVSEYHVERYLRDAKSIAVLLRTSDAQRTRIAADLLSAV